MFSSASDPNAPLGRFGVTGLSGLGTTIVSAQQTSATTASVDLGDLKASRDVYFLLKNTGSEVITDIELTSGTPELSVSPSFIATLEPDADSTLLPILQVSVTHGVALDGVGFTDILAAGAYQGAIEIVGDTTAAGGGAATAILEMEIDLHALVVDLQLTADAAAVDFTAPEMHLSSSAGGLGWLPLYCGTTPSLRNTGNTSLDVTFMDDYPVDVWQTTATLAPEAELTIPSPPAGGITQVHIDGDNVIADHSRFAIGNDGNVYFAVSGASCL